MAHSHGISHRNEFPTATQKRARARRRAVLAAAAWATLTGASLHAATTLTWDADGVSPVSGGGGTWNTTDALWTPDAGANYQAWNNANGDSAVLGSTAGTVSLGEDIVAGTLTINTAYTLDLNGHNLTIASTGTNTPLTGTSITNTGALATFTVNTGFGNTSGPIMTGNLNVNYSGGAWNPGVSHSFTGTLSLLGTGVIRSDGVNFGGSKIRLGGTHTLQIGTAGSVQYRTFTPDIELLNNDNSNAINPGGMRTLTLSGVVSGVGRFREGGGANQGAIILAGNNTYSGNTYVAGAGMSLIAGSDNGWGNSTLIETSDGITPTVSASTIGFTGNANVGTTPTGNLTRVINLSGAAPGNGLGSLQNFTGNNTYSGNVTLGSNTQRIFGAYPDSSLTLKGVISAARGIIKTGPGTIILTGKNTFGTNTTASLQGGTAVNMGVLRLDFSQTEAGHDVDILNNGNASPTAATYLMLGGGTLEIQGRAGATNSQRFLNYAPSGAPVAQVGFQLTAGGSYVKAIQNGATSLSANLGQIRGRSIGATADLTLPSTGNFTIPFGSGNTPLSTGASGQIIALNASPFMTAGGTDWAARDASANVVTATSLGLYTNNDGTTLAGNADMVNLDATLAVPSTSIATLRFSDASARTLTIGTGQSLATGGILISSNVGNNLSRITTGTLTAATGTTQDLVIHQHNAANVLQIDSVIADNGAVASALTKSGPGRLVLTTANTYTGTTTVNEGMLKLNSATALPGGLDTTVGVGESALVINGGGVIGLTSDFTRAIGAGAGQVRFAGSGGFAAYGGDRTVNFSGAGANVSWNAANFLPTMSTLILSAPDADGTLIYANALDTLSSASSPIIRTIQVENGSATVDARFTGALTGQGDITKTGLGTLELATTNTYTGNTVIAGGSIRVTGSFVSPTTVNAGTSLDVGIGGTSGSMTGNLIVNGAVTFNRSDNSTYSGGILSGSGSVTKIGGGTLVLTGTSTFTGNTTVSAGTFQIGNGVDGAGGSYVGDIANNSAVVFNRTSAAGGGVTYTYGGSMSGTGTVTKLGATGNLVLTGNSSYSGGTTISAGVVEFSTLNNLGAGGITFTGGTLRHAASTSTDISSRTVTLGAGGGSINTNGNTVTYAGSIGNGGVGGLTKTGAGTLSLNNPAGNSYSGNTVVNNGTLLVNNTTGSGTGSGNVTVQGSGTLGGSGIISGTVTTASGAHIRPGSGGAGTLTTGALTLVNNTTLDYDLSTSAGGANDRLVVASAVAGTPTDTFSLAVTPTGASLDTIGSYVVIDGASGVSLDPTKWNAFGATGYTAAFSLDANSDLVVKFTSTGPAVSVWDKDDSTSLWSATDSWVGGVPNAVGASATFGAKITDDRTVTVDGQQIVGTLTFDNAKKYTLVPGQFGGLIVVDSATSGSVTVTSGSHDIVTPVQLNKDTTFTVTPAGSTLTVSDLTATGVNVTKAGSGMLAVNRVRSNNLTVNGGTLALMPNGQGIGVSKVAALSIASGARIDISDNHLITTTSVGTATGGTYNGVSGYIQSGRGTGVWDGTTGIVTSQTDATVGGLTSIGSATAQQVLALATATDTGVWAGQVVTGSDTLVMYTYGGDANLDGKVSISDYGKIDFGISIPGADGWYNGDFNYDGKVTISDYGIIDFTIGIQGSQFFTGSGAGGVSGVSAVPEPASISVIGLGATVLLGGAVVGQCDAIGGLSLDVV